MEKKQSRNSNRGVGRRNIHRLKSNTIREIEKPILNSDIDAEIIQVKQEEVEELVDTFPVNNQPEAGELDGVLRLGDVKTEPIEDAQENNYAEPTDEQIEIDDFALESVVVKEEYVWSYPGSTAEEIAVTDGYDVPPTDRVQSTKTDATPANKRKPKTKAPPAKTNRQLKCFACRKPFATESLRRTHMKGCCSRKLGLQLVCSRTDLKKERPEGTKAKASGKPGNKRPVGAVVKKTDDKASNGGTTSTTDNKVGVEEDEYEFVRAVISASIMKPFTANAKRERGKESK